MGTVHAPCLDTLQGELEIENIENIKPWQAHPHGHGSVKECSRDVGRNAANSQNMRIRLKKCL